MYLQRPPLQPARSSTLSHCILKPQGVLYTWCSTSCHNVFHRAALASLPCSDWLLGNHARNYFAKALLPALPRHQTRLQATERWFVWLAGTSAVSFMWMMSSMFCLLVHSTTRRGIYTFLSQTHGHFSLNFLQDSTEILSGSSASVVIAFGVIMPGHANYEGREVVQGSCVNEFHNQACCLEVQAET